MTTIDTPDHQYGQVSAQHLLAAKATGTITATVDLPENLETLVVIGGGLDPGDMPTVAGVTTGVDYPGVSTPPYRSGGAASAFYFDVSTALDTQVKVTLPYTALAEWYVYSDYGTHVSMDPNVSGTTGYVDGTQPPRVLQAGGSNGTVLRSLDVDNFGRLYTIPGIPSTDSGVRPPVEFLVQTLYANSSQDIVAAPVAADRLRIFSIDLYAAATGAAGGATQGSAGGAPALAALGANVEAHFRPPAQGYAFPPATSLSWNQTGGTNHTHIVACYTVETV